MVVSKDICSGNQEHERNYLPSHCAATGKQGITAVLTARNEGLGGATVQALNMHDLKNVDFRTLDIRVPESVV